MSRSYILQNYHGLDQIIDQLDQTMRNSPGNFYVKSSNGEYLFCNENQAKVAGLRSFESLIGKTDYDTPWGNQAPALQTFDKSVFDAQRTLVKEEFVANVDGDLMHMLSEKQPFFFRGKCIGICGTSVQVPPRQTRRNSTGYFNTKTRKILQLTPQQERCLFYLLEGKSSREIGKILTLSYRTVEHYIEAIRLNNDIDSIRTILLFVEPF